MLWRTFSGAFWISSPSRGSKHGCRHSVQAVCFCPLPVTVHLRTLNFLCCLAALSRSSSVSQLCSGEVQLQKCSFIFNATDNIVINELFHICSHHFHTVYELHEHMWTQIPAQSLCAIRIPGRPHLLQNTSPFTIPASLSQWVIFISLFLFFKPVT